MALMPVALDTSDAAREEAEASEKKNVLAHGESHWFLHKFSGRIAEHVPQIPSVPRIEKRCGAAGVQFQANRSNG